MPDNPSDIVAKLNSLHHVDWMAAYQSFEYLQQLPYAQASKCFNPHCPGVIGDGTMGACIRVKHLSISEPTQETSLRNFVKFQQHTCIKLKATRDLLTKYKLSIMSNLL